MYNIYSNSFLGMPSLDLVLKNFGTNVNTTHHISCGCPYITTGSLHSAASCRTLSVVFDWLIPCLDLHRLSSANQINVRCFKQPESAHNHPITLRRVTMTF